MSFPFQMSRGDEREEVGSGVPMAGRLGLDMRQVVL